MLEGHAVHIKKKQITLPVNIFSDGYLTNSSVIKEKKSRATRTPSICHLEKIKNINKKIQIIRDVLILTADKQQQQHN